jgi:GxxExxY protein
MTDEELSGKIIGCAMKVHRTLGPGFLEAVYQRALRLELSKQGLSAEMEKPIEVTYEGETVGTYVCDFLVSDKVILELKAIEQLAKAHEVQLVNYLKATGINVGLLLNFGGTSLEFKRKHRLRDGSQK